MGVGAAPIDVRDARVALRYFGDRLAARGECWIWTGSTKNAYGRVRLKHYDGYAHRWSWELHRSEIPGDLTIDHLCRVTLCVNPDHLEPVPLRVNQQRANPIRVECPSGHRYVGDNLYVNPRSRKRYCRECHRQQEARRKARMREAS